MYYYKSKKGNKVLCLEHPIEEDLRYSKNASLWQEATQSDYENFVAQNNARIEIAHLEKELERTDWIIVKIAEEIDSTAIANLRSKYASVIDKRKIARARINQLEAIL